MRGADGAQIRRPAEFPLRVMSTSAGHVRVTLGVPQAAEVIEKSPAAMPQLSPEFGSCAFPTFGPEGCMAYPIIETRRRWASVSPSM